MAYLKCALPACSFGWGGNERRQGFRHAQETLCPAQCETINRDETNTARGVNLQFRVIISVGVAESALVAPLQIFPP